jgi:hypothetical protein
MRRRRAVVRRGPGLLGAAAIGGVAYAAGRHGARQAESGPTVPATSTDDRIRQLQELAQLREAGVLTDTDVEREKDRILRGD